MHSLVDVIKILRSENGCPWDKDQTPMSVRRDLMEEVFEALDAITADDKAHIREELGDVLFNVLLIVYMYEQKGEFSLEQVLAEVAEKLVRRHPHVFPESSGKTEMESRPADTGEVLSQWDRIKENLEGRKTDSVLDEVPAGFPPLLKAYKMLSKASKRGFEWNSIEEARNKVVEELEEVDEAASAASKASDGDFKKAFTVKGGSPALNEMQLHLEEEVGDLFLALVNYSRWLNVDPCVAVDRANRKFYDRFSFVEKSMKQNSIPMTKDNCADMIRFWNDAKNKEYR